ncbi:hypothetical protein [Psychrobacillus sp. OK032]|uniref:hypothetical protein n=1 Tax=Psychrobacillus sp. OK032 TaxID=1884358 RepID=UPI0008B10169|nr:hypothetical protein [Psychrobacillus sp. OK032]SER88228.1 hypothetical protein SAMN05518872_102482 [Psychrobacillus sp. OK032]
MAKLTLVDGTIFEGTTEELFAITQKFGGEVPEEVPDEPAKEITHNGATYTLVERKAQAGDVVILCDTDGELFSVGRTYEVEEGVQIADRDGELFDLYRPQLRRTTDTVLVYAPKVEPLKVGESVIIRGNSKFGVDLDGKLGVYEGTSVTYAPSHARVNTLGERTYVVKYEQLRKATDEEVAEAKAKAESLAKQAAKDAVFTKAGRKPNEYRKGDIVRVLNPRIANLIVGEVGEITSYDSSGSFNVTHKRSCWVGYDQVEPVTFAESRLDRK